MTDFVPTLPQSHPKLDGRGVVPPFKFNENRDAGRYKAFQKHGVDYPSKDREKIQKEASKTRVTSARNGRPNSSQVNSTTPLKPKVAYSPYARTSFEFRSLFSPEMPDKDGVQSDLHRGSQGHTIINGSDLPQQERDNSTNASFKTHERTSSGLRKTASDSNVQELSTRTSPNATPKLFRKPRPPTPGSSDPVKAFHPKVNSDNSRLDKSSCPNSHTESQRNPDNVPKGTTGKNGRSRLSCSASSKVNHQNPRCDEQSKMSTSEHNGEKNVEQTITRHETSSFLCAKSNHAPKANTRRDIQSPYGGPALMTSPAHDSKPSSAQTSEAGHNVTSEEFMAFGFVGPANRSTSNHGQTGLCNELHKTTSEQSMDKQEDGQNSPAKNQRRVSSVDPTSKTGQEKLRSKSGKLSESLIKQASRNSSAHEKYLSREPNEHLRPPTPPKEKERHASRDSSSRGNYYPSRDKKQKFTQLSPVKRNGKAFVEINTQNTTNCDSNSRTHKNIDSNAVPYHKSPEPVSNPKDTFYGHGCSQFTDIGAQESDNSQRTIHAKEAHHENYKYNKSAKGREINSRTVSKKDKYNESVDSLELASPGENTEAHKSPRLKRAREKLNIGLRRSKDGAPSRDKSAGILTTGRITPPPPDNKLKLKSGGRTESNILPNKFETLPLPGKIFRSVSNENFVPPSDKRTAQQPLPVPVLDASKRLTEISTRSVYLSSQSLENFSNFDRQDFKRALQRNQAPHKFSPLPQRFSRRLDSAASGYSAVSVALGDITEDESECNSDLDLEDENPPWGSSRIETDSSHIRTETHPWHSKQTPPKKQHEDLPSLSTKNFNFKLSKPYLQNNRSRDNSSHFRSESMPEMNKKAAAVPSYATTLHSQMGSNKPSLSSTESLLRTRASDRQISVSMAPFASSSMTNFRPMGTENRVSNTSAWNPAAVESRPKSRRGRLSSMTDSDSCLSRETPVPRNSPEGSSHPDTTRKPLTVDDTAGAAANTRPSIETDQSMNNPHARPLSAKGRSKHRSLKTEHSAGTPQTNYNGADPNMTEYRPVRPQSSKGRTRVQTNAAVSSENSHSQVQKSRPKSSKGRSRTESLKLDSDELKLDLSSVADDPVLKKDRPDSAWQKKYRKPKKDLDLKDSGNDTDVDGEIEILDLDKIDPHDSWSDLEVGVTGIPGQDNASTSSSRSSRGSDASAAWDARAAPARRHSNSINPSNQSCVDAQSDTRLHPGERAPDTPRLTPMQHSIRQSHNFMEINGSYSLRSMEHHRMTDDHDMRKYNKSSNIHNHYGGSDRNPFHKIVDPVDKQKQDTSPLTRTNNGRIRNEKLISKYRNRVSLKNKETTTGALPSDAVREHHLSPIKNVLAPIPRKLEPLSPTSNHGDHSYDMAKQDYSPDSGISESKPFNHGGILSSKPPLKTKTPKHLQEVFGLNSHPPQAVRHVENGTVVHKKEHRPSYPELYSDASGLNPWNREPEAVKGHGITKRPVRQSRSLPLH